MEQPNPFGHLLKELTVGEHKFRYYDLQGLNDARLNRLPYSIRVLLESAVRNCDEFNTKSKYLLNILMIFQKTTSRPFSTGSKMLRPALKSHSNQLVLFFKILLECQLLSTLQP